MNSPNAFLLSSGFVGPYAGTVNAVEAAGGAKKVTLITDDPNPAGKAGRRDHQGQLKSHGFTEIESVTAHTQSDPTYATAVAEALNGEPEAIIMVANPTDSGTLLQGLSTSGYEGTIVNAALILTQQVIEAVGAPTEGVYLTTNTPSSATGRTRASRSSRKTWKRTSPTRPSTTSRCRAGAA